MHADGAALSLFANSPESPSPRRATRRRIPQSLVNVNFVFYAIFRGHSLAFFPPFRHQRVLRWWSNQVLMLQNPSCLVSLSLSVSPAEAF